MPNKLGHPSTALMHLSCRYPLPFMTISRNPTASPNNRKDTNSDLRCPRSSRPQPRLVSTVCYEGKMLDPSSMAAL